MKLRYFYRLDHKKQPILGSNVRRKSKPGNQWKEIHLPCCSPVQPPCTCGPRFFVQLDGQGKPVDYTIIKRDNLPEMDGKFRWYELMWQSPCCLSPILWALDITDTEGTLVITINGVEVVNTDTENINGSFEAAYGDTISVTLTNTGEGVLATSLGINFNTLNVNITNQNPATYTFVWNGEPGIINAIISSTPE